MEVGAIHLGSLQTGDDANFGMHLNQQSFANHCGVSALASGELCVTEVPYILNSNLGNAMK